MFSIWGRFLNRSAASQVLLFFYDFLRHVFCKSMRWKQWKSLCFFDSFQFRIFEMLWQDDDEKLICRWILRPGWSNSDGKTNCFFTDFGLRKVDVFWCNVRWQRFPAKSKIGVLAYTCSKNWWFSWILRRAQEAKYWILARTCSKSDGFQGGPRGGLDTIYDLIRFGFPIDLSLDLRLCLSV